MSVVVHLRDGRNQEVRQAYSCNWTSAPAGNSLKRPAPRWLVCHNQRGDIIATFPETEIAGYKKTQPQKRARVRFPKIWNRSAV